MQQHVKIAGIPIDPLTYDEALIRIRHAVGGSVQEHWVTVNPEMVLRASADPPFRDTLLGATVRTADGVGILWAARYLHSDKRPSGFSKCLWWLWSLVSIPACSRRIHHPFPQRITGTDLMLKMAEASEKEDWTFFLLGADEGVAEQAIENITRLYPWARFVGCHAGSSDPKDDQESLAKINLAQPNILLVAYGSPAQEFWIRRNLPKLTTVRVAIGVGGAFDFHAGKVRRAPLWMRKIGLEWLWRLLMEPSRIKRIWNAAVRFPLFIYGESEKR